MPQLPGNIGFGHVIGQFVTTTVDSADPDVNPEAVAATGTVTFTPSVATVKNASASPPVTIVMTPTACTLVNGELMDAQNSPGVYLIATDSAALDPNGWTYKVDVSLNAGSVKMSFDIAVPTGSEIDLATVVPV